MAPAAISAATRGVDLMNHVQFALLASLATAFPLVIAAVPTAMAQTAPSSRAPAGS
jgi:hypothetical protein